jgi:hypothetical protein
MIANPTAQQLALVSAYVVMQRAIASQMMKLMNQMNALNGAWTGEIAGIVNAGTMGQTIVDNTGLAGAAPLTDNDVTTITSYMQNVLATYYDSAHQQELVKACGPGNAV